MAEINEEYEIGFKDGLKSKIGDELLPMIEQILVGVSDAVKSVIPLMIDRMEIKANLDSNDWIPCSERLPEEKRRVLLFTEYKTIAYGYFTGCYYSNKPVFAITISRKSERSWYEENRIAHWMPLPEPPKIGGTDNVDS